MGADIMLVNGDLAVSITGDIALVTDGDEIIQTAINNMSTIYGELDSDPTRGNMIFTRRVKLSPSGLRQVESDCKNAILQDTRVADIPYISATRSTTVAYECDIEFTIRDIDGNTHSSNASINLLGR
jgi:hypothetical protein